MNHFFIKILFYFLLGLFIIPSGCKLKCKDVVCFNNGSCSSGSCQCDEGYNKRDYLEDCREVKGYFEFDWVSENFGCNRYPKYFKLSKSDKNGAYNVSNVSVRVDATSNETNSFNNESELTITEVSDNNSFEFILNIRDTNNYEIFYNGTFNLDDNYLVLSYNSSNFDQWYSCNTAQEVIFHKDE
ncbi:MAG: hypothetical protein WED10_11800 [Brumimicrobium sp.]